MMILDQVRKIIDGFETRTFYYIIIGYLSACFVLSALLVFSYYHSTGKLYKRIKTLNTTREEEVRTILESAALVKQQQTAVEEILAQDPDFKIAGYFKDLLIKLNLKEKEVAEEATTTDQEDNYRKSELNAKFEDMSMKELTELLQELEQKSRIATQRLEITKSKKKPKTIEVNLSISTLLPKIEVPST